MSWVVVLIILLVFAMMLGPLMLLKPGRRQQQIARLRLEAAQMGLQVTLSKLGDRTLAVYQRLWPKDDQQRFCGPVWELEKLAYQHEIHFAGTWQWRDAKKAPEALYPALRQSLNDLPNTVEAVAVTPAGLAVYWTETGGVKELAHIKDWLDRYAHLMLPYMHRPRE